VKESGHILLEGSPEGFDRRLVASKLGAMPGVISVDHIHAWSVTQERPVVTMEISIEPSADSDAIKHQAKKQLHEEFGIEHSTIEIHRL
jgi:cobalt-zinc-cadmium efflux system protein